MKNKPKKSTKKTDSLYCIMFRGDFDGRILRQTVYVDSRRKMVDKCNKLRYDGSEIILVERIFPND